MLELVRFAFRPRNDAPNPVPVHSSAFSALPVALHFLVSYSRKQSQTAATQVKRRMCASGFYDFHHKMLSWVRYIIEVQWIWKTRRKHLLYVFLIWKTFFDLFTKHRTWTHQVHVKTIFLLKQRYFGDFFLFNWNFRTFSSLICGMLFTFLCPFE